MDARLNTTYIILGGHVQVQRYRYLYFLVMLAAYILIILSNSTIVCLIVIHKNLHQPMYIFIAALLINSVLFSTNIYPKLLIDFLSEKQIICYQACLFQIFAFYFFTCSEFLLLAAMAYDRYVSICKPLQYPIIMRKSTVSILLFVAWVVPACHIVGALALTINNKLCSFTLRGVYCNNSVNSLYCSKTVIMYIYGVIILFNVGFFPILFILFTYTKILVIAHGSCGEVKKKAIQTCLPHLLVLINLSSLFTSDVILVRVQSDFTQTAHVVITLQIIMFNPLFNPLIYGLKMKQVSKHLKRLFCRNKVAIV
ncbi:olfactory receptor 4B1-like [Odontesthes bonariensis]|uniref:olfactory receptor 4B1-like n=1 Tax=Odontesthes bonariensis TaxID=219752 RepID=UPI003F588C34